jgi:transcriptional regulator with XRE-family HTH domain
MNAKATKTEKEIDELIDEIKSSTGLTQQEIAKKIGYSRSYLSQAKKGDSDKLYSALEKEFKGKLENLTNTELADLIKSNQILAEANKTLADAHLVISKNNEELISIAKAAFNLHILSSTSKGPKKAKGGVETAADELNRTGRTGPFFQAGSGTK